MHIESILPLWLVIPLVSLALFIVWMVYLRRQDQSALIKPIRIILAVSRFFVLVIIGLLIISPFFRISITRQNKPYYVIVQDNSVSVPPVKAPEEFVRKRGELIENLSGILENRYQLKKITFGNKVADGEKCSYTDSVTDPGDLFTYLRIFARTHDLAGVFLTSDGVATQGVPFAEAAKNFPYPVAILASGDSTRFPDVQVIDVVSNEWVRKNSNFPVRVYYKAVDYTSQGIKIQILGDKGILAEKLIDVNGESGPFAEFLLRSPEKGTMQLTARIIPDQPDKNQDNNYRNFSIKIIEQEGEILLIYESVHPDINAIMQALKKTDNLNIELTGASSVKETELDCDLIILHGLPSKEHPVAEILRKASDQQTPILFIIGQSTDPDVFNRINHGMVLDNRRKTAESSQGLLNASFTLYSLPPDFSTHLNSWPPLNLSFETFSLDPGTQILMKQKILNIELPDALVAFSTTLGTKYGFICGEGIWLWRMHEFLEYKNHDYFDEWVSRTVQYLILDEKKEKFRIVIPDELFAYSPVRIHAHLLNNSMEAVNKPDLLFSVFDSAGLMTEYQMGRVHDYYELNTSGFAPGTYQFTAETQLGNENFVRKGLLTMMIRPIEQAAPVADYESLRSAAAATNGSFFSPDQEGDLFSYLNDLKTSDTGVRKDYKWYDLINFKWLFAALFFLLAMEWFLRRWHGIR